MNVDMHAHIFTREALSKIEKKYKAYAPRILLDAKGRYITIINGRSSGPVEPMEQYYDVKKRIKMMDDEKVDVQVLSVTPGNFCYDVPPEAGLAISVAQNDAIADIVATYPERFIGSATVPLQDADMAVEELERAVRDLGFTSVEIGSNVAGRNLDSIESLAIL